MSWVIHLFFASALAGIYLTVTMAMTSLSIVLTVFVLQLHHVGPNQKRVPRWVKRIVIDVIARVICMRAHVHAHYGTKVRATKHRALRVPTSDGREEVCLTSFVDHSMDYTKDSNNCNGRLGQSPLHMPAGHVPPPPPDFLEADQGLSYERLSRHLKILVSQHEGEDQHQDVINEWRLVAGIMDRFLFWLFLIGSVMSSLCILVFKPMTKPT